MGSVRTIAGRGRLVPVILPGDFVGTGRPHPSFPFARIDVEGGVSGGRRSAFGCVRVRTDRSSLLRYRALLQGQSSGARTSRAFTGLFRCSAPRARNEVVIQSLFPGINGKEPAPEEIEAYAQRLKELKNAGAQIPLVQIYSAPRPTPRSECGHLPLKTLSRIARRVREVTGLKAEVF